MGSMIERVARLLCQRAGIDPPDALVSPGISQMVRLPNGPGFVIPDGEFVSPAWKFFEIEAAAVLEAMKQPTEEMLVGNASQNDFLIGGTEEDQRRVRKIITWTDMVRAAARA